MRRGVLWKTMWLKSFIALKKSAKMNIFFEMIKRMTYNFRSILLKCFFRNVFCMKNTKQEFFWKSFWLQPFFYNFVRNCFKTGFHIPFSLLMAKLTADDLIYGYINGIFPMADSDGTLYWYSPDPRAIIPIESYKPSKSLRPILCTTGLASEIGLPKRLKAGRETEVFTARLSAQSIASMPAKAPPAKDS